ncbi:TonB-dependent outer membrane receptor, partial [mine drainage metagenome]
LAASTAALVPHVAQAQMASATLEGTAPPGTKIIATDIATGASRVTIASKNGNYILIGLPPGRYRVKAGKQIQELTLSVASTLVFDFTNTQLRAAELKQITISGRRLIDVKTPAVGGIVTHRMIETVPEITRNFLGFADILPGISFTYNNGDTSFRGGTQESENNNVYIGGMPMTNFIQGGITGQGGPGKNPNLGDPGNPFPQSAIASYRVINSNYSAQYA